MSKRYAVLYTFNMWCWLEQHPGAQKKDYFKTHPQIYIKMSCAVCSYDSYHPIYKSICKSCPMLDRWPTIDGNTVNECGDEGSCYDEWCHNKNRARNAGDIAQALWKLYKELENEDEA